MRAYIRNDSFFKAISHVLAQRPETRFICPAMKGEPQAENWVSELGIEKAVTLLPRLDQKEMADLFRQGMVVVSPSEHDGTPNSVIEAMACRRPCIVTGLGGQAELVVDEESGLHVPPGNPAEIAEAIVRLYGDPGLREQLGSAARRRIATHFNIGQTVEQTLALYRELAAVRRAAG